MEFRRLLLGRRLANREHEERKIGAFEGIAAMGLDGLGSSAYGPEAALAVLAGLGAASSAYILPVMVPVLVLLALLFASYWQTISAYPSNGGAYTVAKENLGTSAALLAAAALMIDYVLNVAVGISAGVGALVSAVPSLHPYTPWLCLGILALVAVMNLRGTGEAGRLFALPTYLFVASVGAILVIGLTRLLAGHAQPLVRPPPVPAAHETLGAWLVLRAFASGCTAMTGVEAVSNGMGVFRDPPVRHGHRTLAGIVIILGLLLAGISWLCSVYGIGAMDQTRSGYRSVLSQLAGAVVGDGLLYGVAIASVLIVLCLSANTSFVGFPGLCRLVAADGFLPKTFAIAGQRLVFSVGILYLAAAAGVLLVVFGGITDRLIPLFAVGAFATFTLSQTGMVVHWRRALRSQPDSKQKRRVRVQLVINSIGAFATAAALVVIIVAKFVEGAWITVLIVPAVIALLVSIKRYYLRLERRMRQTSALDLRGIESPIMLVALQGWNEMADRALKLALSLSPHVIGLHLMQLGGPDEAADRSLRERWARSVVDPAVAAGLPAPELMVVPASYRTIHQPILRVARELELRFPDRTIAILIPELVKQHWYQRVLHTYRGERLRGQLLRHGGSRLTVINVPWYLEDQQFPEVPRSA
jgi:amino acid transporter